MVRPSGDPQPLSVLVDFLVGESVQTLARKNGVAEERVESALRTALALYDFSAMCRASPPEAHRVRTVVTGELQCS
jgi:hypothetical protein